MKISAIQIEAESTDEIIVHAEKETVRIFANSYGRLTVDRWSEEDWRKKLGAPKV
jgi:hypothetical protein